MTHQKWFIVQQNGGIDLKKKAVLIVIASAFFVLCLVFLIYYSIPYTILSYESEDGKTIVTITQKKVIFEPIPSRVFDYSLNVSTSGWLFKKTIYSEDFTFNATGSIGIKDDNVEITFSSDEITVLIDDKYRPVPRRFIIQLNE